MKTRLRMLLLLLAMVASAGQAQQATEPTSSGTKRMLDLNAPVWELLEDARTRPVLEKHLPNFAERLLKDEELARMFGNSTLRELAVDPHVRGLTPEVLEKIGAELREAQKPAR